MPGPKGVIMVEGSFKQAYYCEQECVTQATVLVGPCAPDGLGRDMGRAPMKEATKAPGGSDGSASPSI